MVLGCPPGGEVDSSYAQQGDNGQDQADHAQCAATGSTSVVMNSAESVARCASNIRHFFLHIHEKSNTCLQLFITIVIEKGG